MSNNKQPLTKAEILALMNMNPEMASVINEIADAKVEAQREARNEVAREARAVKSEVKISESRKISGLQKLAISKAVAREIICWDANYQRYDGLGKVFMAISFRNDLKETDTRKYHLAHGVDESCFYLYPAKNNTMVLCYINITNRNARQFYFVNPIGLAKVEAELSKLPKGSRITL